MKTMKEIIIGEMINGKETLQEIENVRKNGRDRKSVV